MLKRNDQPTSVTDIYEVHPVVQQDVGRDRGDEEEEPPSSRECRLDSVGQNDDTFQSNKRSWMNVIRLARHLESKMVSKQTGSIFLWL